MVHDQYVVPQTYLEVWGNTYMNDGLPGTCEYRSQKPVHHIISTEYDEISPQILNEAWNTSLWRVPGEGTP